MPPNDKTITKFDNCRNGESVMHIMGMAMLQEITSMTSYPEQQRSLSTR